MQNWRCKCGESTAFGSMWPQDCEGCNQCNTTYAQHPDHHKIREPHEWKIRYNENTGKPYQMCNKCSHIDRESYDISKIKD